MVKGIGKINFHTAQTAKRQLNIDRTASILAKKSTKMSAREVQANICNAIPILMELRTVRQVKREEMVKGIRKISRRPQGLKKWG